MSRGLRLQTRTREPARDSRSAQCQRTFPTGKPAENNEEINAIIYLTKVNLVFYHVIDGRKRYFDLGLPEDADARIWRFKSFFIEATSLRVGTLRSASRFSFSFMGVLMTSAINLADILTHFSTDEKCRELLKRLRWPDGVKCPRCHDSAVELDTVKDLLFCNRCQYQFTATAGTIFHDSHLPLVKWFMATLLICEARKGISANQIKRTIGVSYKTAWYLCHRIRSAMGEARKMPLYGKVEMDETYVGGRYSGKRGRGAERKEIVIGLRQRKGPVRFFHAADVKAGTLAQYIKDNIGQDLDVLMTDEFISYPFAMKRAGLDDSQHETVNHKQGEYVRGDIHTNSVESAFSLLKRGIIGTWHKLSAKHLQAYLEEMEFRFNRRNNDDLFLDTLTHMVTADPLTFERLTA